MAKNMEIALLLDFYGEMLTEKQKDMVELYYNDDLSLSEIAENAGISRQGVRDSIKRAEGQLLEMEGRLGLARRFREMQRGFEVICNAAQEIGELNQRLLYSREVAARVDIIVNTARELAE